MLPVRRAVLGVGVWGTQCSQQRLKFNWFVISRPLLWWEWTQYLKMMRLDIIWWHNVMSAIYDTRWHNTTQDDEHTIERMNIFTKLVLKIFLIYFYSTFHCMPFNFVMTHYWYTWYRATECLAAIHGVFEIESIWIINKSIASPSHIFRDSDRKEYLPIETYPSIGIHCTEDSRHHLEKDSAFTTLYGSKTLSNCPQSNAPNPLFSAPPAWNGKDVKKNVKKDGAAIGQTDHLGQTPRRSKHPSFPLFLPLVPLEEPFTSKL